LRLSKSPTWTPPAEVYETADKFGINIELAGLTKEDIKVNQINNVLIVRGTRRFRRANEEAQYHSSERVYGTFERLFPLPNYVKADDPQMSFSHGILEITLPKSAAAATESATEQSHQAHSSKGRR
jgi:HSP20 family protein